MKLKNKTVAITGVTGGMGRELVRALDKEGVKFILISKTEAELENLSKTLKNKNNKYFACDFTKQEDVLGLCSDINKEFESVDVLINLAGIGIYKPLEEASLEEWNNSLNIGVTASFILTKGIIGLLKRSKDSLVVNLSSGAGVIPMAGRSLYCTMKFALRGLTLSLAEEFKRTKPSFCLITLGSVLTSFGPMSLEEKKEKELRGTAYFTPEWVPTKLVEIIKDDNRKVEYTMYPGDYSFGWQKNPQ